jgi:hypothetical protein
MALVVQVVGIESAGDEIRVIVVVGMAHSGSTRLNELDYRPDAIKAQLTHAQPNSVRRTYNYAT